MKYYLIVGEASGDLHASHLMTALKKEDEEAEFRFLGGDLMAAQGGTLVKHYREMAFMGFLPVLKNLRTILRNMSLCKQDIQRFAPDVVILVDYPGFNMKIAKYVKTQLSIPVYYYISPKIWAWKEYRVKSIRRYVDRLYSILPFEVEFYRKHHYEIQYVGNPSVDELAERSAHGESDEAFVHRHGLDAHKPIIALLPGSRRQEITANLQLMLDATASLTDYQLVVAGAPGLDPSFYESVMKGRACRLLFGATYGLLQQAHAAVVTSGTATLETALFDIPQVVCYSMDIPQWLYTLLRPVLLRVPYISLVNLIVGREVCRELVAYQCTSERLKQELHLLLFDPDYRQRMFEGYEQMRRKLGGPGAARRTAADMVDCLRRGRQQ